MVVLARELSHTANHALLAIIVSIMTVYQESVLEATSVLKRLRNPFHVGLVHIILTNEQLTQLTVYHAQLVQIVLKEVLMIGRDTYVPAGTYNDELGGAKITNCTVCPAGYFCKEGAVAPAPCDAGYFCPNGSSV